MEGSTVAEIAAICAWFVDGHPAVWAGACFPVSNAAHRFTLDVVGVGYLLARRLT